MSRNTKTSVITVFLRDLEYMFNTPWDSEDPKHKQNNKKQKTCPCCRLVRPAP